MGVAGCPGILKLPLICSVFRRGSRIGMGVGILTTDVLSCRILREGYSTVRIEFCNLLRVGATGSCRSWFMWPRPIYIMDWSSRD